MTPSQIEQALSEWTGVIALRAKLGKPHSQLIAVLKAGVKAGRLEERWAVPDWYPYSKNKCQWQVRRRRNDANDTTR